MPVSDYRSPASQNPLANTTERRLLHSVVEVARSVFGAAAASIFLLDQQTGELVFEAVSGEGEGRLPGTRFPRGTGIAGWAAATGQPMLVDSVHEAVAFAEDAAASTGFVPSSIMAAPLLRDGECIGVLEVLDRGSRGREDLQDVDLLALVATQAGLGLELLIRLQWALGAAGTDSAGASFAVLQRIAQRLPMAPETVSSLVTKMLQSVDELLASTAPNGRSSAGTPATTSMSSPPAEGGP